MNNNKKLTPKKIIVFACACMVGIILGNNLSGMAVGFIKDMNKPTLAKISKEANKLLPIMMDADTRIDSIKVLSEDKITYFSTLVNYDASEVPAEPFTEAIKPDLIENLRVNAESNMAIKFYRQNKVTVSYIYLGKDGNEITEIKLSYEDYK